MHSPSSYCICCHRFKDFELSPLSGLSLSWLRFVLSFAGYNGHSWAFTTRSGSIDLSISVQIKPSPHAAANLGRMPVCTGTLDISICGYSPLRSIGHGEKAVVSPLSRVSWLSLRLKRPTLWGDSWSSALYRQCRWKHSRIFSSDAEKCCGICRCIN
jgi:hypothetical protein